MSVSQDFLLQHAKLTLQELQTLEKGVSLDALNIARRTFPNNRFLEEFYKYKVEKLRARSI